jgi:hypothetical protein
VTSTIPLTEIPEVLVKVASEIVTAKPEDVREEAEFSVEEESVVLTPDTESIGDDDNVAEPVIIVAVIACNAISAVFAAPVDALAVPVY